MFSAGDISANRKIIVFILFKRELLSESTNRVFIRKDSYLVITGKTSNNLNEIKDRSELAE